MNRKDMEARRAQLIAARDQMAANVNVVIGHLEELDHWLAQLPADQPDEPPNDLA